MEPKGVVGHGVIWCLGLSRCSVRAGLHACESVAEEIFTMRVSVILSTEGVVEISLWIY